MLWKKLKDIDDKQENLKLKKVLLIGAGGIGCELLKCLVMIGIKKITIVDLDKVEKSNLNRQFLFHTDSIGQYKSLMAKDSIIKLTQKNDLEIEAFIGNIKDYERFNLEFFTKHDLVLNALDNVEARSYINKICNSNNIPLINSGTEGYLGSVMCYFGKQTACFDCTTKIKKKAIPICSIRSKPEKIEHCIAWAKSLFELLISQEADDNNPLCDYLKFFQENKNRENNKNNNIIKDFFAIFGEGLISTMTKSENDGETDNSNSAKEDTLNYKNINNEQIDIPGIF